ncbi:tRNA (adenosine(37)-N6)-threonylcarbamoyltransferase complex ATPase subunit type 1 TsaE [Pedobacter sp. Leaf176]|uniref:tRNA (adenosine(37)-N6)-threonylcarbamoyltransferase complex ATPase subunit type 1 TsaE n=1 Tax=Pedobacter sp. Leaf176 TaxID=1736286 RepID=UPI0006F95343|nr:tRNA (adenosine(37)-N6)-threonylcarbamoyltransferase complex ATPase subunit type 1 TsaE [Pedobacter sp. Leaf176]KQR71921.1 tRNA threonylcarbamoyladenosine biosynthesis protein TsaE [Pedobacter sp. Leaf176]
MEIQINGLTELPDVANKLLAFAGGERIFLFDGEMGAGKTTFIKTFCKVLGVEDSVSSPTYSIVNEYVGENDTVYHFDFYRIKNIQEAYDLGYEEYFYGGGICLIEWPERIEELLPEHYIKVEISILSESGRSFKLTKN